MQKGCTLEGAVALAQLVGQAVVITQLARGYVIPVQLAKGDIALGMHGVVDAVVLPIRVAAGGRSPRCC